MTLDKPINQDYPEGTEVDFVYEMLDVTVDTIDALQGCGRKMILLSLVTTGDIKGFARQLKRLMSW